MTRHALKPQSKREPIARRVRVRVYPVISEAVQRGCDYGWMRVHKHNPEPTENDICEAMADAVMTELCGILDFDPEPEP